MTQDRLIEMNLEDLLHWRRNDPDREGMSDRWYITTARAQHGATGVVLGTARGHCEWLAFGPRLPYEDLVSAAAYMHAHGHRIVRWAKLTA